MVDIKTFCDALKLANLKAYCKKENTENPCNIPFDAILKFGGNVNQLTSIDNPYWDDVLKAWNKYCKKSHVNIENPYDILSQPLWFNHHYNKPTLYYCFY